MTTNKMAAGHSRRGDGHKMVAGHSRRGDGHKMVDADDGDEDHGAAVCGVGGLQPAVLQACANMPAFTAFYSLNALMTSTLSSYVNSQVTTLERQFGFSSAQTGLIMAANDVGFLVLILFVSFFAARVHIPRGLGVFTILFGVSGIMCSLPHFIFGAPSPTSSPSDVTGNFSTVMTSAKPSGGFGGQICNGVNHTSLDCDAGSGAGEPAGAPESSARAHAGASLGIIVAGMVLQGVAKTPRSSFATVFVDNNVHRLKTGFYMGIIIAIAIMGPAVAFALGGLFTRIYVTLEDTDLHFRHPRWIGAWWLGYLTFGCASCVVSLPLFCFPRRIKRGKPRKVAKGDHSAETSVSIPKKLSKLVKGFVETLCRLAVNPVYLCTVLSSGCLMFAVAGSQSFTPKYMENQFDFPAWKANMAMAGVMLSMACLGTFVGGYLTKQLRMGPLSSLQFVMAMTATSAVFTAMLMAFKCDQPLLHNSPGPRVAEQGVEEGCGGGCVCDDGDYFPVCAQDGRTFFSPCHAGCQGTEGGSYVNCTCIAGGGVAEAGGCDYSCAMFYPFIVCFSVSMLLGTLAIIPKILVYIRAVEERDKPLALGLASFITSVTGWMLGPIIFGKLIDGICIQWEESCTGGGACRLYDNDNFRLKLLGYQAVFRVMALVFVTLAYISAKVTKKFAPSEKELLGEGMITVMVEGKGDNPPIKEDFTDPD